MDVKEIRLECTKLAATMLTVGSRDRTPTIILDIAETLTQYVVNGPAKAEKEPKPKAKPKSGNTTQEKSDKSGAMLD